jgi:integrase
VAIVLAAVTGARRGELCALRWSDVNWERRVLTIARSLTEIHGAATEGPTKTHQRRDVALDDALLALLLKRRADQEDYAAMVGTTLVPDPFILSPGGSRRQAARPRHSDGLLQADGKQGLASQLTSTSCATSPPRRRSGRHRREHSGLGHADASVTLRIYARALEARDRDLAKLLSNAVLGPTARGDA